MDETRLLQKENVFLSLQPPGCLLSERVFTSSPRGLAWRPVLIRPATPELNPPDFPFRFAIPNVIGDS